ncbi:hypothetical protein KSS87_000457, partial [Heliosperma pusillum]
TKPFISQYYTLLSQPPPFGFSTSVPTLHHRTTTALWLVFVEPISLNYRKYRCTFLVGEKSRTLEAYIRVPLFPGGRNQPRQSII